MKTTKQSRSGGSSRTTCSASSTVQIAEKCADQLLCAFDGKPVNRLQLMRGPRTGQEENMGGWCRAAIVDIIAEVLRNSPQNASVEPPSERNANAQ